MRYLFILITGCLILAACSKKTPVSIEEEVLMKSFASLIAGEVYDRICQNGDITKNNGTKDMNVNLYGNTQLLVARIGGLQHIRFPDKTADELVSRLLKVREIIVAKMEQGIKTESCKGSKSTAASAALQFYTKTPPWTLFALLDRQIIKQGGTVTPLDKIESAPVKK